MLLPRHAYRLAFFFFNDTPTTEIYTLSLHDALPIYDAHDRLQGGRLARAVAAQQRHHLARPHVEGDAVQDVRHAVPGRSEEHTSELQSQSNLVCRLLLEKKNSSAGNGQSPHVHARAT